MQNKNRPVRGFWGWLFGEYKTMGSAGTKG